jgi:hypothetical protein
LWQYYGYWVTAVFLFPPMYSKGMSGKTKKKLARSFNFAFRYIDDVLWLNNSRLDDVVERIYFFKRTIMDITDITMPASYHVLHNSK